MRMFKPQNVPYGRHNDYILKYISVEILVTVGKVELSCRRKGICLVWSRGRLFPPSLPCPGGKVQVSESNLEPSPAGKAIREPKSRGESSWCDTRVQRYRYWLYFFSPFGMWSAHAQMSVGYKTYHVEGTVTTF